MLSPKEIRAKYKELKRQNLDVGDKWRKAVVGINQRKEYLRTKNPAYMRPGEEDKIKKEIEQMTQEMTKFKKEFDEVKEQEALFDIMRKPPYGLEALLKKKRELMETQAKLQEEIKDFEIKMKRNPVTKQDKKKYNKNIDRKIAIRNEIELLRKHINEMESKKSHSSPKAKSPPKTKKVSKKAKASSKSATPSSATKKMKRCPNGTRRNKKTGKCEPK